MKWPAALPSIRTISLVQVDTQGPHLLASTSSDERPEALDAAVQAVNRRENGRRRQPQGHRDHRRTGAARRPGRRRRAVVTVSLGAIAQLRTKGRRVTLLFAPIAVLLLTLLIDWFARRLIHQPVARIHEAMHRAGQGDFSARASIVRPDEIGDVASGLNDMLSRLQNFNVALQERVEEATAELRVRNQELVESYHRVFALREALGRAEQLAAIGQTAASVAHQVGTPLNLISGYIQMTQEDAAVDPRTARRLTIVQEQITKVASVVRNMLDHARRPDTRWPTALGPLLSRVGDVARPKLDASKIALTLDLAPNVPAVEANAEELELALLNLVNNSLDAMPDGGSLTIRVTSAAGRVRIELTDTGGGIAPDLLPRIFEPWVTTKAAGRGTGLGLSITRDVIGRHGGTIDASQRNLGARLSHDRSSRGDAARPADA
jgi:signal transduction histidine kinase